MRFSVIVPLLLLLPPAVQAQTASSNLVIDWERNRQNVMAYLEAMPDSALGFRPTPGVRTFAEQFDHIVSTNLDIAAAIKGLDRPPVLGDSTSYLHNKTALRAYANATYDYLFEVLKSATPSDLARSFTIYNQPSQPAGRWLELTLEHSVWTLGQVVPYLRLNHATPPAYSIPF